MKRTAPISIRVKPDVKAAIERLAKEDKRSLSAYVELVLEEHIERTTRTRAKGKPAGPRPSARQLLRRLKSQDKRTAREERNVAIGRQIMGYSVAADQGRASRDARQRARSASQCHPRSSSAPR
jgi:hypothetical protein